ncbi:MAG: hypothetical protein BGO31_11170 [Bacteroidetes bacterium 43-16]|uniref:hypothetical protein n=1 Tax=uncultured Dysgonomonas sp. TaxID=206096 RepID=UPI00092756E1|nr:hypothetical protein [uncultured Dysgonomonas sp.]OJV51020.1 MAG: hypothetical protein BGO31_11170 [Bacteroidetes bacterium 43-16]
MYQQLKEKLWSFIVHNNPDLMFNLQDEYKVTEYLETKVSAVMPMVMTLLEEGKEGYAILELCMNEMTAELKPSRYHYIAAILQAEFPEDYVRLREAGQLSYQTVLIVDKCKATFDVFNFGEENKTDPALKEMLHVEILLHLKQDK